MIYSFAHFVIKTDEKNLELLVVFNTIY